MQYEAEVNGRVRQVAVHRTGDTFDVAVDGRLWRVDAARIDAKSMSLVVQPGARSYDVGFAPDAATGLLYVRVGTTQVAVALNGRRRRHDDPSHAGEGPQRSELEALARKLSLNNLAFLGRVEGRSGKIDRCFTIHCLSVARL